MKVLKKSWLPVAIAFISVIVGCLIWRIWSHGRDKNTPATIAAGRPQLVIETGHSGEINTIAFSPDGRLLASGSQDTTILLWDIATGAPIRTLSGHSERVDSVAFTSDGKGLMSWSPDYTIKLWDLASGKEVRTVKGGYDIWSVVFSPDGKMFAGKTPAMERTGGESFDNLIKLWDAATGAEVRTFIGHTDGASGIAFSPDGKTVASGNLNGGIRLWDVATGTEIRTLSGIPFSVIFSPDGKTLASGYGDDIKLWDVATGTEIRRLTKHSTGGWSIAWSLDGRMLASPNASSPAIDIWDVTTGTEIRSLIGHTSLVKTVAFSPDGKTLASAGWDNTVKLWDGATGAEIRTLTRPADRIWSVALRPDGKMLAIGTDRSIRLWDATAGVQTYTFKGFDSQVDILAFSPDNRMLVGGNMFGIKLWDAATGSEIDPLTQHIRGGPVTFSPDSKMLAVAEDHTDYDMLSRGGGYASSISLWDVTTGKEVHRLTGHTAGIRAITFSPDGKSLATAANTPDNTIKLWDVATGTEKLALSENMGSGIAFSPDGKMLAGAGPSRTIVLRDVATGAKLRTFSGHTGNVESIAFSPDGKMLVVGGYDGGIIKRWDVATGRELQTLTGHSARSLAFIPDGKVLVSGPYSGSVIEMWDVTTDEELASLYSFGDDDWVIVTPEGRFDTSRIGDIKGLHWQMPDAPLTPLPIEIFMRDYYEPKLLPRILARESFKPVRDFSTLNLTQPEVKIIDLKPDSAETVQVSVEVTNVKSATQYDARGNPLESGVFDVRLFRDGQLVGYAPTGDGPVELNKNGKSTLKFPNIKWPRTGSEQVEFSAYAFNADRIKSATDRKTYTPTPKLSPVKGRAYIISLGVNAYEREGLNLRYAANDARQVQSDLVGRLASRGDYEEVIGIPLVSDYSVTLADGRTVAAQEGTIQQVREGQKGITENHATKAHLQAVLDVLAGRQTNAALLKEISNAHKLRTTRPEDLVLLSVSSHGYTDNSGIFYIVPSDTGDATVSSPEFRKHCISSDELSLWLRDVDAGDLVMIVDACHSAAAVEGTDFKPGPMGSRGLGQLSYDKGMKILTATQADNVALEANQVRQGLLIYALLQDGLGAWRADYKPQDKSILLAEWLGYGVERVPRLYEEVKTGQLPSSNSGAKPNGAAQFIRDTVDPRESETDKIQQPSLFDFARRRREVILARQP